MQNFKLNFFHTCDFASFDQQGKLNVLGIFENIYTPAVPYSHPQMFIVSNISFSKSGKFKEVIKIISEDGLDEVAKLEFPINVKISNDEENMSIGVFGQLNGVKFGKNSKYKVQILIDENLIEEKIMSVSIPLK